MHLLNKYLLAVIVPAFLLSLSATASADKSDKSKKSKKRHKVEICHYSHGKSGKSGKSDKFGKSGKSFKVISVSKRSLKNHLRHGDLIVGVDVDENCEELSYCFTINASYPPNPGNYLDEIYSVEYFPTTGEIFGVDLTWGGEISGSINPAGQPVDSIFASGSIFNIEMLYDYDPNENWLGEAISDASNSGFFEGTWEYVNESFGGVALLQFTQNSCEPGPQ